VIIKLKLIILFHFSIIVGIFYIGISLDKKGINPISVNIEVLGSFTFRLKKVNKKRLKCVTALLLSMVGKYLSNSIKISFQQIWSKMVIMAIKLKMTHIRMKMMETKDNFMKRTVKHMININRKPIMRIFNNKMINMNIEMITIKINKTKKFKNRFMKMSIIMKKNCLLKINQELNSKMLKAKVKIKTIIKIILIILMK